MWRRAKLSQVLAVSAFAVVGVTLTILALAATPNTATSTEPETGTVTTPAHIISDTTASSGHAVQFESSTTNSAAILPSQVLNLSDWKITLPIDGKGGIVTSSTTCSATEIKQPQLAGYSLSPWFTVNSSGDGVTFRANIEGCTTSGSGYPRSELREENGSNDASWSTSSGAHTMTAVESVDHLPVVKPQTTFAQIHNANDDVFEAEATGHSDGTVSLNVNHNGTVWGSDLDDNYVLGTKFTLKIIASGGYIDIYYNGLQKVHEANTTSGDYFKVGDYTQSNIVKGHDAPGAYGQVTIYDLQVTHA